jgi:hypothetical protein
VKFPSSGRPGRIAGNVLSKLKGPVLLAHDMSGFHN